MSVTRLKMAAPMDRRLPSEYVIKTIVIGSVLKSIICFALTILPLESKSFLSLIHNFFMASKINIITVIVLEIVFHLLFNKKHRTVLQLGECLRCFTILVMSSFLFQAVAILFGASFLEKSNETYHFALLLTSTTVLPCCLSMGSDVGEWIMTFSFQSKEVGGSTVAGMTSVLSILGAWLGAFPIPLDWDRPWQVWPRSCVIGNMIGYSFGLMLSSLYLLYKYSQLRKNKLM